MQSVRGKKDGVNTKRGIEEPRIQELPTTPVIPVMLRPKVMVRPTAPERAAVSGVKKRVCLKSHRRLGIIIQIRRVILKRAVPIEKHAGGTKVFVPPNWEFDRRKVPNGSLIS